MLLPEKSEWQVLEIYQGYFVFYIISLFIMTHSIEEIQSAWKQLIEKDILYHDVTRFRRRGFLEINGAEAMKLSVSIMNFISENYLQVSKENRFF